MKLKFGITTIVLCLTGFLLSACSSSSQITNDVKETTDNVSSGPVNLRLWGAEEDAELLKIIADSFCEEYKDQADITITIEAVSESACKDAVLDDVLNAPDVFTFADDQLTTMVEAGLLKAVNYNVDDVKSRNSAASVDASSVNGVLYAYPLTADNGYFLFYNKKYFNASDLESLDSILAVCEANDKKVTMDWTSGWYLYALFGNTGLTVGLNEDGMTNYCTWNSTENSIKGVDVAKSMLSYASNPYMLIGGDGDLSSGAADDTVIAGVSGVWLANSLSEAWGSNMCAAKLPTYTVAGKQVQMSSYAGYKMVGVNSYSENLEWAEKLADWVTNEANQKLRFEMRAQGPSNSIAAASEAVAASPAIQALIAQSEYSSLQRIGANYWSPAGEFGSTMKAGNPDNVPLQDLLDKMVNAITASN